MVAADFLCAQRMLRLISSQLLSGGVMVALGPLEASVMVRIHAGQPMKAR